MTVIGGRNAVFAWFVGVVCALVVIGLGVLAAPMMPAVGDWVTSLVYR